MTLSNNYMLYKIDEELEENGEYVIESDILGEIIFDLNKGTNLEKIYNIFSSIIEPPYNNLFNFSKSQKVIFASYYFDTNEKEFNIKHILWDSYNLRFIIHYETFKEKIEDGKSFINHLSNKSELSSFNDFKNELDECINFVYNKMCDSDFESEILLFPYKEPDFISIQKQKIFTDKLFIKTFKYEFDKKDFKLIEDLCLRDEEMFDKCKKGYIKLYDTLKFISL